MSFNKFSCFWFASLDVMIIFLLSRVHNLFQKACLWVFHDSLIAHVYWVLSIVYCSYNFVRNWYWRLMPQGDDGGWDGLIMKSNHISIDSRCYYPSLIHQKLVFFFGNQTLSFVSQCFTLLHTQRQSIHIHKRHFLCLLPSLLTFNVYLQVKPFTFFLSNNVCNEC